MSTNSFIILFTFVLTLICLCSFDATSSENLKVHYNYHTIAMRISKVTRSQSHSSIKFISIDLIFLQLKFGYFSYGLAYFSTELINYLLFLSLKHGLSGGYII